MSVGCGPCTELAAIDYLREKGILNYEKLRYRGIDPLGNIWNRIWDDITDYFGKGIKFYYKNISKFQLSPHKLANVCIACNFGRFRLSLNNRYFA